MLASHGKGSYLVLHSEIVQGLLQLVDEQISLALLHPGLVQRVHDLHPMTRVSPADSMQICYALLFFEQLCLV